MKNHSFFVVFRSRKLRAAALFVVIPAVLCAQSSEEILQEAHLQSGGVAIAGSASVDIEGNTAVVGAISLDSGGSAYVFVRNGAQWTLQRRLQASNPSARDGFGTSVAISGDTLVIGAHLEDSSATGVNGDQNNNNAPDSGAAYIFVRNGTNWTQQAYLKASNTGAGDFFGSRVNAFGDTVIVGAHLESSEATGVNGDQGNNNAPQAGAAYVFVRNGADWSQQAYLKASNTASGDSFGGSLDVYEDTVIIGADSQGGTGAAYVFVRDGANWSQQAYLKASNAEAGDGFGGLVAIDEDTVVVGATVEDSKAIGVNGDQANNSALDSGAAYVFVRNGTSWSQQAYLKASNTERDDMFGSVGIFGDTIVVGATWEASSALGVNGDQSDNSAPFAGAAYVFVRSGTTWSQRAYLKASNTSGFGGSPRISGDTLIVGGQNGAYVFTGLDTRVPNLGIERLEGAVVLSWPKSTRQHAVDRAHVFSETVAAWRQFAASQQTNAGRVWTAVPNAGGAAFFRLRRDPLTIMAQPQSRNVVLGQTVTLSVNVQSGAPAVYQWHFNGTPLAGETNAVLVLNAFAEANQGDYFAVLSDPFITLTSAVATVLIGPTITQQPQSQTVSNGAPVTFAANALGNGPVTWQWQHAGTNIPGATNSSLTLPGVQTLDEGTYIVVVTDDFGAEASQPAVLGVIAPITFVMRPASRAVAVGDDVTFTVEISGGPPPFRYTWRKNITQVLASHVQNERTVSFIITNVQLADAGNYLVHVTNSVSAAASLPAAVLTVTDAAAASR